jgi:subtilisin family serine protease
MMLGLRRFWTACTLLAAVAAHADCGTRLGPQALRSELDARPAGVYAFIVRGTPALLAGLIGKHAPGGPLPQAVALSGIGGVALGLTVDDAFALCEQPSAEQIWLLRSGMATLYVRVLQALEHQTQTLPAPSVINLSLGPPIDTLPQAQDAREPMHLATRRAAEKGLLPVFAIGNKPDQGGSPGPNPWCLPAWVVCVGAATSDAQKVWQRSVEGDPNDAHSWPDVVAPGVDIISTWPSNLPKSDARRQYDEADPRFQRIPADRRHLFTIMSGTSQAAAHVSRAAAQIAFFLASLVEQRQVKVGDRMFSLEIPKDRYTAVNRAGSRLAGDIVATSDLVVEVAYRRTDWWKLVKQLLVDTALPMPGYAPHQVGAGFVSPAYIEKQFGAFGVVNIEIAPDKVL